jgi:GAF domain-containing protein
VPVDRQALASTLQALLQTMDLPPETEDRALLEHLDRVMEVARDVLRVDGVGLLLLDEDDRLRLVGASDAASTALERGQQHLNVGPAIDCVRGATTVMVTDLAGHTRYLALWRWLSGQARSQGDSPARAVLSAPVRVRGDVTGTLNALHKRPQRWSADQVQAIEAYGNIIGVLLRLGDRPRRG